MASAASSPIFVPPNETTSAPSTTSRSDTPSEAAAFASREPSMWNSIPCACA